MCKARSAEWEKEPVFRRAREKTVVMESGPTVVGIRCVAGEL